MEPTVPASGQLRKAYTYILNQEKYLRVFLEDGEVPIEIMPVNEQYEDFVSARKIGR